MCPILCTLLFSHAPTDSLEVGAKCVCTLGPRSNKILAPTYTPTS